MPIKYVLAASLFFLAAARAPAQESDASGCAEEDAKWCNLKAKLGQLPNLSRFLQGDEEKGRQFAAAAYNSPASQDEEWKAFDTLLGGGRLDPGGALISGELKSSPRSNGTMSSDWKRSGRSSSDSAAAFSGTSRRASGTSSARRNMRCT